jgi:hypothetical protein
MQIGVIIRRHSTESEISLMTNNEIIKNLDKKKYVIYTYERK